MPSRSSSRSRSSSGSSSGSSRGRGRRGRRRSRSRSSSRGRSRSRSRSRSPSRSRDRRRRSRSHERRGRAHSRSRSRSPRRETRPPAAAAGPARASAQPSQDLNITGEEAYLRRVRATYGERMGERRRVAPGRASPQRVSRPARAVQREARRIEADDEPLPPVNSIHQGASARARFAEGACANSRAQAPCGA
jgi:hypothetical protein